MDDPDAPGGTFTHWVLFDLPPELASLPQGGGGEGIEGVNSFRNRGYGGPCPPRGSSHHYFFKLYAVDRKIDLNPGAGRGDVEKAMLGHILAQGELMARYGR
jgi:Raf kinase inhibitor-like YbhB/YbcL family protein